MGIFKKIKDIFYDEEIVEVPVQEEKKEVVKENVVEKPIIEDITPKSDPQRTFRASENERSFDTFSERELFKPEKTFDFPVFEEEPVRTRSKTNVLELQKELEMKATEPKYENVKKVVKPEENKPSSFKPSPVISPIYGILDKNYKKEEVVEKKETPVAYKGEINYDYVRKKAYGSLEDELEDTLTRVNSEIVENVNDLEKELEELPKPSKNIEQLLGEIKKNANVSIGELEEQAKNKMMAEEENEELKLNNETKDEAEVNDNTLEHDLFNLIDSMYEDKEE